MKSPYSFRPSSKAARPHFVIDFVTSDMVFCEGKMRTDEVSERPKLLVDTATAWVRCFPASCQFEKKLVK
jgi:hypothetical protein